MPLFIEPIMLFQRVPHLLLQDRRGHEEILTLDPAVFDRFKRCEKELEPVMAHSTMQFDFLYGFLEELPQLEGLVWRAAVAMNKHKAHLLRAPKARKGAMRSPLMTRRDIVGSIAAYKDKKLLCLRAPHDCVQRTINLCVENVFLLDALIRLAF